MKRQFFILSVALGVVSFLCLVVGGIGMLLGVTLQADHMTRIGSGIGDVGLVGVILCSWVCARCQKGMDNSISLRDILRRTSRRPHS